MATGDVYRVTINYSGQGSVYQNTFAVAMKTGSGPTAATFNTFVLDWLTLLKPGLAPATVPQSWTAVQLWGTGMAIVRDECVRTGGSSFAGNITGQTGVGPGDALPPQSAFVTTLTTGKTGRRFRGRIYMPGQVEGNQADGLWTTTYVTALNAAWAIFGGKYVSDIGTSPDLKLVIWSERTASGCIPATPPAKGHVNVDTPDPDNASTQVLGWINQPVVYSQRRRTRGVGR